jgi:hypothetical protein
MQVLAVGLACVETRWAIPATRFGWYMAYERSIGRQRTIQNAPKRRMGLASTRDCVRRADFGIDLAFKVSEGLAVVWAKVRSVVKVT